MSTPERTTVLTVRVSPDLDRRLGREARRRGRTKSAVLREVLESTLGGGDGEPDPALEARRQSLLVSGRASEREAIRFVERAGDQQGWK